MENTNPNIAKKKILCIEDERFIGELYERALTQGGYDVKVVSNGQEGLNEAKTNAYDVILLDLMVPDVLGVDILSEIQSQTPAIKAKIIVTTNLEQKKEVREDIEKRTDGYIIKAEITPRQLVEIINSLIGLAKLL